MYSYTSRKKVTTMSIVSAQIHPRFTIATIQDGFLEHGVYDNGIRTYKRAGETK